MKKKVRKAKIPETTVARLSRYLRVLADLEKLGFDNTASYQLAEELDVNDSQVRRDLSYFGQFGKPGMGYETTRLKKEIQAILGLTRKWKVVLVGMGNLGSALLAYKGFRKQGFYIVAAFDNNPKKIGRKHSGIVIQDITRLEALVRKERVQMGIIAVSTSAAQEVAELLTGVGVKAILNFAPARISVSKHVRINNVDLSSKLENLSFFLSREGR